MYIYNSVFGVYVYRQHAKSERALLLAVACRERQGFTTSFSKAMKKKSPAAWQRDPLSLADTAPMVLSLFVRRAVLFSSSANVVSAAGETESFEIYNWQLRPSEEGLLRTLERRS